jgi:DNA modification methylase
VRLITPPGGKVGDPFIGSGSTAVACQIEGHDFEGCDVDPGAVEIARSRTAFWTPEMHYKVLRDAKVLRAAMRTDAPAKAKSTAQLDIFNRAP